MCHIDLVQPRCLQSQLQGVGDILGFHRGAELAGNDVAREVVKNRRQVEPTPAGHLQVSEVGLPKLVRRLVAARKSAKGHASGAARTAFDGRWSVIISTRSGSCDPQYRFGVQIISGNITYEGGGAA